MLHVSMVRLIGVVQFNKAYAISQVHVYILCDRKGGTYALPENCTYNSYKHESCYNFSLHIYLLQITNPTHSVWAG